MHNKPQTAIEPVAIQSSWIYPPEERTNNAALPPQQQAADLVSEAHALTRAGDRALDLTDLLIDELKKDGEFCPFSRSTSLIETIREVMMQNANAAFDLRMRVSLLALRSGLAKEVPHV